MELNIHQSAKLKNFNINFNPFLIQNCLSEKKVVQLNIVFYNTLSSITQNFCFLNLDLCPMIVKIMVAISYLSIFEKFIFSTMD